MTHQRWLPKKFYLCHCMLDEFREGKNDTEATAATCSFYEEDALSVRVCQQWFVNSSNNNLDLEDDQHSGKAFIFLGDLLFQLPLLPFSEIFLRYFIRSVTFSPVSICFLIRQNNNLVLKLLRKSFWKMFKIFIAKPRRSRAVCISFWWFLWSLSLRKPRTWRHSHEEFQGKIRR